MSIETNNYQPEPLLSRFRTTLRNELHDWLRRLIMYSAYYVSINSLLRGIPQGIIPSILPSHLLNLVIFGLASIPMLLPVATWSYWHMGFKSRIRLYFVSVLFLCAYFVKDFTDPTSSGATLRIFWYVVIFICISFLIRRLTSRNRHRPDFLAVALTIVLTVLIYLSLWKYITSFSLTSAIENWWPKISVKSWSPVVAGVIISLISIVPGLQYLEQTGRTRRMQRMDRSQNWGASLQKLILHTFALGLTIAFFMLTDSPTTHAFISLGVLFLAANPGFLLSRQKAHSRNLWKHLGLNNFNTSISLDPLSTNWIRIQLDRLKRYQEQNAQNSSLLLILIIGGIFIPVLGWYLELEKSLVNLTGVAITSSLSLTVVFLTFWFVNNRKKHIVLPFIVAEGQQEPQLQSLANLMTHAFVKQLRHIALLLSMRQVESIASRNDTTLPVFVTSGQEQELIEQVRSLGDIDISNKKVPLGGLLAYVVNSLAHTKVRGTIVRQKDNSVAVLVEFSQRGGQVVAVDMAFVPETSAANLDQVALDKIAETLAIKLIIQLGKHAYLATSWESLQHFLNGLDAAYHRNWWSAISSYRKAIQLEDASSGSSGTAYYHLGASMVFQGEMLKGMKYLEIAEMHGTPKAETQYMMALAQFHMNRDYLHFDRINFEDIRWRCQIALKSRPNFPEAHHLMGTIYYQRGKLLERAFTRRPKDADSQYKKIDVLPQDYSDDYKKAAYHLTQAISGYDKAIRFLPKDPVSEATFIDERTRLIQYRMSATHRLGDALRSQERYSEGDTYYQETLSAFPANIRTLVDMAKTYCLSSNWQQADQFIRKDIFNHEENRSNKSACFYMGWSLAGGLVNEFSRSSQVSDIFLEAYEFLSKLRRTDQRSANFESIFTTIIHYIKVIKAKKPQKLQEQKNTLGRSMLFLDFAIHQYPRYIHRWKQTDWYDDFHQAVLELGGTKELVSVPNESTDDEIAQLSNLDKYRKDCYRASLDVESSYYVDQLYLWICWRIASFLPINDKNIDGFARHGIGWTENECVYPFDEFTNIYKSLVSFREKAIKIMEASDKQRSACNLELRLLKFKLSKGMLTVWEQAVIILEADGILGPEQPTKNKVTFAKRWAVDVFAELAVLTVRMLAESEAYETVEIVAKRSDELLQKWLARWKIIMSTKFFFSPKVLNYQIASLNAWRGYSKYQYSQDFSARIRREAAEVNYIEYDELAEAQIATKKALKFVPSHPLAIYTDALILNKRGHSAQAADDLNRLISQVSPFDPHTYQKTNNFIESSDQVPWNISREKSEDIHLMLYYGERIWGRLQFFNVMNTCQIHIHLSQIARELDDLKSAIGHIILAIADTPYYDEQAENLLSLVELFTCQSKYSDAQAVLDEISFRREYLSPVRLPSAKSLQVLVTDCITKTNLENYRDSLKRSQEIAHSWGNIDLSQGHNKFIDEIAKDCANENIQLVACFDLYKNLILQHLINIETDGEFEGVVENADKLRNLITALHEYKVSDILKAYSIDRQPSDFSHDLDWILTSQILTLLYSDIVTFLIQLCEWMNNCAFNYTELGFYPDKAQEYTNTAIELLEILEKFEGLLHPSQLKERLAQYYDTLGWIYYRRGSKENLKKAYKTLCEKALPLNQESALIYYHLARVRLAQIEQVWLSVSPLNHDHEQISEEYLRKASKYIREAFINWRHAHRLDKALSLYSRLRIVRLRLDRYRNNWEMMLHPIEKIEKRDNADEETDEKA